MINRLIKEVCEGCSKSINIGQAITECFDCSKISHTKCFKKSKFEAINGEHYCSNCCKIILKRYNPFKLLNKHTDNDSNHSYNQELTDCIGFVAEASRVLEECKNYEVSEINAFSANENAATLFSTLFYNIGGNKSNFDNFAADIKALKLNYSVIGLAETNTDPNHGNLYPLDGYKPFYNPCMKDKSIGTGVALYVEQSFNPTILDHLCYCTENIETFFMKIHKDDVETCVGVVYRSPNSNHSEFLETYKTITAQLKSNKNIHILGDFNTNLFKHNDPNTKNFEDHFLIEGLYPTVSIQTHKRGNTTGSCIDNIFISDVQYVICSGVIPGIGKHHSPIFTLASLNLKKTNPKNEKHKLLYDYSNKNIDNFIKKYATKD